MADATFACADLTTFCRLDELGLEALGQRLEPDRAVLACRVVETDSWCRRCGCEGTARDTVTRQLSHEPLGWRPTALLVTVRRLHRVRARVAPGHQPGRRAMGEALPQRAALGAGGAGRRAHDGRSARGGPLAVSWNTAKQRGPPEGRRVLLDDGQRFDGVAVIGVDEHVWRHSRRGDRYVTVTIDLTPVRDRTGPSPLLDVVPGRSKQAFRAWLARRPDA